MADEPEVILYTDGACSGNPGPGGWAFILRHLPTGKELNVLAEKGRRQTIAWNCRRLSKGCLR